MTGDRRRGGEAPWARTPRELGLLAMSEDGGAADVVLSWIMGFDWRRIPVLRNAFGELAGDLPISQFRGDPAELPVLWLEGEGSQELRFADIDLNLRFQAHPGWEGRIERENPEAQCAS